jgi:ribosomal protein L37AE/L43A
MSFIIQKHSFQIQTTTDSNDTQMRCQQYNELLFTKIADNGTADPHSSSTRRLLTGLMKPQIIDQFCAQCSRPFIHANSDSTSWKCTKCVSVFCASCSTTSVCVVCDEGRLV